MAFSLVLYVTISLFSLLFLSIAYRKRTRKSPVSVSHSQQLSILPLPSRPARTYDVFLSFRGEDTRNNFVGHLYKALDRYGIYTFKDDQKLKKGKTVAPELLKSIEESRYSIVILSENYATSTWCLDELVKIIHCMDQFGQIVLPIFYNVDSSDVRKQTGSFKRAFDHHERAFKKEKDKVLQWRKALRRVGSISGSDSRNRDESVLIEEIVQDVSDKLFSESSNDDNKLVGMSYHMEQMNSLLCNDDSEEVLMVGIYGMGGIGKTTISRALYNRYSRHYDGRCYVSNVKDIFRKHDSSSLQERLLSEIFLDRNLNIQTLNENFNVIKERLSRKKVFIVLDDVDDVKQLETLADKHEWFGPGSRIIITTRDQRLLISHGVNYLYEVPNLRDDEAFQLFSQYAFKQDKPTPDYFRLSDQFVSYANGLPLALKVLGSFLYKKNIDEWRSERDKLKKIPNAKIQDVLRISFDGLDDKQKDIFLDIACFFKKQEKNLLIDIGKSCGFFPETGLRVLAEKSLITISEDIPLIITDIVKYVEMHDLLCGMGKEVVRQESIKEPGKRSRLWLSEDICYVFKHNTGTKAIEGIFLDISNIEELQLTREAFRKMHNLRLLKIYNYAGPKKTIKVHLPDGLEVLSDKLRLLHWHGYPLKCLPCNFQPENLVELIMPYSNLEQSWEATKNMKNLKRLKLTHSRNLKYIGDLSLSRNLEIINLEGCISLQVIHPSIQYLDKLKVLNLVNCKNLRSPLETAAGLVSLKLLNLSGCSKITELPDNLGDLSSLVFLKGDKIGINRLPSSISNLKSLKKMLLSGCKGKHSASLLLPPLWGLDSLEVLELKDFNILEFPEGLAGLPSLETLDLSGNSFESIDLSLGPVSGMIELKLNECKMLQSISNLPPNIIKLQAHNCSSLEIVSSSICKQEISLYPITLFKGLRSFVFTNCFNLKHISLRNVMIDLLDRLQDEIASIKEFEDELERLPNERLQDLLEKSQYVLQTLPIEKLQDLLDNDKDLLEKLQLMLPKKFELMFPNKVQDLLDMDQDLLEKLQLMFPMLQDLFDKDQDLLEKIQDLVGRFEGEIPVQCIIDMLVLMFPNKDQDSLEKLQWMFPKKIKNSYYHVRLCYPGSEIPEWFTHKNVGDSLTLQLQPPEMNSILVGFIVCAVVAFDDYCNDSKLRLRCDFHLTKLDIFESFYFKTWFEKKSYINLDHVLIGVAFRTPGAFFEKANLNSDHVVMKIYNKLRYPRLGRCKIKSCGAHPFYSVECKEQKKYKLSVGNATSFSLTELPSLLT